MSFDAIKEEAAQLDAAKRSQLVAFLLSIEDQSDAAYRTTLTRRIDDRDPKNWITLEEFDRKLSIESHELE